MNFGAMGRGLKHHGYYRCLATRGQDAQSNVKMAKREHSHIAILAASLREAEFFRMARDVKH
jgi:hypothetical protein